METCHLLLCVNLLQLVLTVPMRNGNSSSSFASTDPVSSYRTYEEWKPVFHLQADVDNLLFLPYLWGMETQKILHVAHFYHLFLPYLWGMETTQYQQTPEHYFLVLTVPMRNGNRVRNTERKVIAWVLTVPMRNGNIQHQIWICHLRISSYRTYEEWKHLSDLFEVQSQWWVLTVPMRNGNSTKAWDLRTVNSVLTVPMRNGNAELWNTRGRLYLFLPYLWGMEIFFSTNLWTCVQ